MKKPVISSQNPEIWQAWCVWIMLQVKQRRAWLVSGWVTQVGAGATGLVALMVGTIIYNNGVRSNSVTPAVADVEQERAILRCMSVGMVDARLHKAKKEGVV